MKPFMFAQPSHLVKIAVFVFCALLASMNLRATENTPALPEDATHTHNGVASCATSACHGKTAKVEGRNVWLNEYHVWSTQDRHSRAYQTLLSKESKAIAEQLNLPSAHTAKVCLDCHADNVAVEKRGAKFQISDGVGCEACHGGSEKWLKTHTEPTASHASNIQQGLYPTESPYARAALCLSCHVGTESKFADHQMMAAGHPRLSFELDTFTANQPAHYNIDNDYKQRKGELAPGYLWMVGQVESTKRLLTLVDKHGSDLNSKSLAIFDCHSCHRPMKPRRGQPQDFSNALPPGSPRLLDYSLDMVAAIIELSNLEKLSTWKQAVRKMHGQSLSKQLPETTQAIRQELIPLEKQLKATPPTIKQLKAMRKLIAQHSASGNYDDFTSAEQAFLAIESLSYSIGDRDKIVKALDIMYKSVADEFNFTPSEFSKASAVISSKM